MTLVPPLALLLALTVGAVLASSWVLAGISGSFLAVIVLLAVVLSWREHKFARSGIEAARRGPSTGQDERVFVMLKRGAKGLAALSAAGVVAIALVLIGGLAATIGGVLLMLTFVGCVVYLCWVVYAFVHDERAARRLG